MGPWDPGWSPRGPCVPHFLLWRWEGELGELGAFSQEGEPHHAWHCRALYSFVALILGKQLVQPGSSAMYNGHSFL